MAAWASVQGGKWHRIPAEVTRENFRAKHRSECGVVFEPFNSVAEGEFPIGWRNICQRCMVAEADALGAAVVARNSVDVEALDLSAAARIEAAAKGGWAWTPKMQERASTTAFMMQRQRQADAWVAPKGLVHRILSEGAA